MSASSTVGQKRTKSDSNEPKNIKKNKTVHFSSQTVELENKLKESENAYNELNQYKNSLLEELQEMKEVNERLEKEKKSLDLSHCNLADEKNRIERELHEIKLARQSKQAKLMKEMQESITSTNENTLKKENDELKKRLAKAQYDLQQGLGTVRLSAMNARNIHKKENDDLKQKLAKAEATIKSDKKKLMALIDLD